MSNIIIKEIPDQVTWDNFIQNYKEPEQSVILQSWNWGQFQKSLGRMVWYWGIFENKTLIGVCLAYKIPTKLRTHIYVSNGPIIDWKSHSIILPILLKELKMIAITNNAIFVRMDPLIKDTPENSTMLNKYGLKRATINIQDEHKWLLDITKSNEELLANMRKNTRYAIRRSKRENVKVEYSESVTDFDKFWNLFIKTVTKQNFIPHPKDYYKKQIESFSKDNQYRIYWAHLNNDILATALIPFYGNTAFYLHATSTNKIKNTFPAHAIIWQVIIDAKKQGIKYFDFWGVAPTNDTVHPWSGFTFFKKGFGGFQKDYIRAHDLAVSNKYLLIRPIEATRKIWGKLYYRLIK